MNTQIVYNVLQITMFLFKQLGSSAFKLQFSHGRKNLWKAEQTNLDKVAHLVESLLRPGVL